MRRDQLNVFRVVCPQSAQNVFVFLVEETREPQGNHRENMQNSVRTCYRLFFYGTNFFSVTLLEMFWKMNLLRR